MQFLLSENHCVHVQTIWDKHSWGSCSNLPSLITAARSCLLCTLCPLCNLSWTTCQTLEMWRSSHKGQFNYCCTGQEKGKEQRGTITHCGPVSNTHAGLEVFFFLLCCCFLPFRPLPPPPPTPRQSVPVVAFGTTENDRSCNCTIRGWGLHCFCCLVYLFLIEDNDD